MFDKKFWLTFQLCMHRNMKHLESSQRTQAKSQNDRPSPEIPHENRTNSRIPARVCDVEGGAVCSKNSTFGYFDGTAWTPRLRSPTPIMAPGHSDDVVCWQPAGKWKLQNACHCRWTGCETKDTDQTVSNMQRRSHQTNTRDRRRVYLRQKQQEPPYLKLPNALG